MVGLGLLAGFFVAVITDFVLLGTMTHGAALAKAHTAHESPYYVEDVGEHGPRHGGSFGDADDLYHYEAILDPPNQLRLYVNDERNRPLNVRLLKGRWTLDPDGASPRTGAFTPSIDGGYFVTSLPPESGDTVHVEVAVLKGTLWAPMEFFLPRPATTHPSSEHLRQSAQPQSRRTELLAAQVSP